MELVNVIPEFEHIRVVLDELFLEIYKDLLGDKLTINVVQWNR